MLLSSRRDNQNILKKARLWLGLFHFDYIERTALPCILITPLEPRLTKVKPLSFGLKTVINCFYGFAAVLTVQQEIISTLVEYKKCSTTVGHFYYLFDGLRSNEICLWQNKSAYVDEIAIAMKSDFVGLWWQISYHPRLASDFI